MVKDGRGWHKEPGRHALAAKGISTTPRQLKNLPEVREPERFTHQMTYGPYYNGKYGGEFGKYVEAMGLSIEGFGELNTAYWTGKYLWPNELLEDRRTSPFGQEMASFWLHTLDWEGAYPLDEEDRLITYRPDSQLHVLISPAAFVSAATGAYGPPLDPESFMNSRGYTQTKFDTIQEAYNNAIKLPPLFLDLDWKDGKWEVTGHEGRHRAAAAHFSDHIRKVPVIIYTRVNGKNTRLYELTESQIKALHDRVDKWTV